MRVAAGSSAGRSSSRGYDRARPMGETGSGVERCAVCGATRSKEARFCGDCGAQLPLAKIPVGAPQPVPAPPAAPAAGRLARVLPPGSSRRAVAGIAAVAIAAIVLAVALLVSSKGSGGAAGARSPGGVGHSSRSAAGASSGTSDSGNAHGGGSPGSFASRRRHPSGGERPGVEPAPSSFPGIAATGRDHAGFNVGSGCSDDPASALPGCSDSPSEPSGSGRSCAAGLTVDSYTTSCGLAKSLRNAYRGDGVVVAFSPERHRRYGFLCRTSPSGTTRFTICVGRAGGAELYVRWQPGQG